MAECDLPQEICWTCIDKGIFVWRPTDLGTDSTAQEIEHKTPCSNTFLKLNQESWEAQSVWWGHSSSATVISVWFLDMLSSMSCACCKLSLQYWTPIDNVTLNSNSA